MKGGGIYPGDWPGRSPGFVNPRGNALDWDQVAFSLAFQCSRRGGELDISLRPDGRVDMKGGAAIVLEGTLTA